MSLHQVTEPPPMHAASQGPAMTREPQGTGPEGQRGEYVVAAAEWRWLIVASCVVLLLASLPTLYAWRLADADHVFTGFVYNTEDGNSYIAKMRLGARGEWLFHIFYTAEPHQPRLVYPFYLLLGKLTVPPLSAVLVYHLARVLLGALLLWTIYRFVAYLTPSTTVRRIAWILIAAGSGSGWILALLGASPWLGSLPIDFWVPDGFVFLVLYNLPHLALAEVLLLWAILWTLQALLDGARRRWILAGLATALFGWIVPFYPLTLAMAVGATLLLITVQRRRVPWDSVWAAAGVGAFALPALLYNAWLFTSDPVFRVWAAQNTITSPHPWHYLAGYIWLLVPATAAAVTWLRRPDKSTPTDLRLGWLLLGWATASLALAYVPFVSQRRLIVLLPFALALPAAWQLDRWLGRRRVVMILYLAVACLSNVALVTGSLGPIARRQAPVFRSGSEVEAITWLDQQSEPDETVLSSFEMGNVLPALADVRVFVGHGPETLHSADKKAAVARFFAAGTEDAWRQALLDEYQIDYVFYGPAERRLGPWSPEGALYLIPIYRQGEYAIYAVAEH